MTSYEFKFSDIFPVNDPVARWLVTLSMGFNALTATRSESTNTWTLTLSVPAARAPLGLLLHTP